MSRIRVVSPLEISDDISSAYYKEEQSGVSTGFIGLDRHYTVMPGQLTIVTGVPSHGKSEFVDALCVNLAMNEGWRFLIFSPENYPIVTHAKKLMRKFIGKPYGKMYNGTMTLEESREAFRFIETSFLFVSPGDELITVDDLIDTAKKEDIDGLIIDPWNELKHRRPQGVSETEYISLSLGQLRTASRHLDIHTWLVAHPKKPDPGRTYRASPPSLYDVSGSAHWYNKADNGITVHRPDVIDGAETHIHITKVRFRNIGKPTGEEPIRLNYNIASGRYKE